VVQVPTGTISCLRVSSWCKVPPWTLALLSRRRKAASCSMQRKLRAVFFRHFSSLMTFRKLPQMLDWELFGARAAIGTGISRCAARSRSTIHTTESATAPRPPVGRADLAKRCAIRVRADALELLHALPANPSHVLGAVVRGRLSLTTNVEWKHL
jgi:hypothetical protein